MSIHDWPEQDRPRERLLIHGADQLTDSELLAILIQSGTVSKSSVDCARELITTFGNLRGVIDASMEQLCDQPGIGAAKFALIQAAAHLGRRYLQQEKLLKGVITSAEQAKDYFSCTLSHKKTECIAFLYLNASSEIIAYEEPFEGGTGHVSIDYRACVKQALQFDASAMIMAHNHPSGLAKPSQSDIDCTEQLIKALQLVDVALIDHIIIAKNKAFSMRSEGFIRSG
jgi:DNA repair protein RadC